MTPTVEEGLVDGRQWSDLELEAEIVALQAAIQSWAETKDLWFDCGFKAYLDHVEGEPHDPPVVTLLICGGDLSTVLDGEDPEGNEPSFRELLEQRGYFYENINGYSMAIYPEGEALASAFARYFHWRWVCSLITEDTADVYQELYDHFARRPNDLNRLHWRDFETLLYRIFQNQGFTAELGPGTADNGVDLRLWQRDPIGDILTIVQAKRYAVGNKIDLTNVAALYGIGIAEGAAKSMFVTTSSYLPVARRFAARFPNSIELAERKDVVDWCARATEGIVADKSTLVSTEAVGRIISEVANRRDPRVLHASFGHNVIMNNFALVIKETKHAALLMGLGNHTVSDDGYGQRGAEIPLFQPSTISRLKGDLVWRAKRKSDDGRVSYWDGSNLYYPWSGEPETFDLYD
ncbi:restriction endonuclease [Rhizobium sp. BT-226]|uniref:restriction endonuclease n=1 Tax=Rhizobium sp. BT-226 TaxID=2986922 RepID=UPI0021F70B87|nr:restriction endonuclease [Rhizobium sp. BT-226]MCW0018956.1 restriction endonuclease [Rhizobium sp. BT-226]